MIVNIQIVKMNTDIGKVVTVVGKAGIVTAGLVAAYNLFHRVKPHISNHIPLKREVMYIITLATGCTMILGFANPDNPTIGIQCGVGVFTGGLLTQAVLDTVLPGMPDNKCFNYY